MTNQYQMYWSRKSEAGSLKSKDGMRYAVFSMLVYRQPQAGNRKPEFKLRTSDFELPTDKLYELIFYY